MPKTKTKTQSARSETNQELDSVYILKLVLFLIVGSLWVRLTNLVGITVLPLPVGLLVGLLFASHDHFQVDRKIEYAVLLVAMLIGFWTQAGIFVRL